MTTFLSAAQSEIENLSPHSIDRIILTYLCRFARGAQNAKPWPYIQAHLGDHRITAFRCQSFQNGLLKRSRESDFYIGSTDKGGTTGRGGYFIIMDEGDVMTMVQWYENRIAKEQTRLSWLKTLSRGRNMMKGPQ